MDFNLGPSNFVVWVFFLHVAWAQASQDAVDLEQGLSSCPLGRTSIPLLLSMTEKDFLGHYTS